MIFDTHSHYDDKVFNEDRDALLLGLKDRGVGTVVSVGADMSSSRAALALAGQYDFVFCSLGVHPSEVEELTEDDMMFLQENASYEKVVAIGEIGLDYHWPEPAKEVQKKWFRRQIELARQTNLPIIVHSRDAAEDTMHIIKETRAYECGGVIHCYSYSPEMAEEFVAMGYYIGVGGVVTFKNARKLVQTVETIPLKKIVLETDCPYLSPEPHRGERNDSTRLSYVAQKIADIKGITEEEVIETTRKNAEALYRLS